MTVKLVTIFGCWWQNFDVDDNFPVLAPETNVKMVKLVTNIFCHQHILSPTYFVSNPLYLRIWDNQPRNCCNSFFSIFLKKSRSRYGSFLWLGRVKMIVKVKFNYTTSMFARMVQNIKFKVMSVINRYRITRKRGAYRLMSICRTDIRT